MTPEEVEVEREVELVLVATPELEVDEVEEVVVPEDVVVVPTGAVVEVSGVSPEVEAI